MGKQKSPVIIYEYGILSNEKNQKVFLNGEKQIPSIAFENLWNFILENTGNPDSDEVMVVRSKGGRRYIKMSRYIGTVQTKDGQIIEILPKIYKSNSDTESDIKLCRRIFLRMLYAFQQTDAKSFQNAALNTLENFPILETYISRYISKIRHKCKKLKNF